MCCHKWQTSFCAKDRPTHETRHDYTGSPMDSDSDSDMVAAPKRELLRNGLKGDKGPRWDGQKTTKDAWWYKFQPYLRTLGLWETANGANRNWRFDPDKVDKYETLNWKLWLT